MEESYSTAFAVTASAMHITVANIKLKTRFFMFLLLSGLLK
jgi:hypothetical protein